MVWPLSQLTHAVRKEMDRRWPVVDEHDPALDVFDRGCFALTLGGQPAGHVATVLWRFRTPFRPRTQQDWVWVIAIWPDGSRTPPQENYPPFDRGDTGELLRGEFSWGDEVYEATPLPDGERQRAWEQIGITEADF